MTLEPDGAEREVSAEITRTSSVTVIKSIKESARMELDHVLVRDLEYVAQEMRSIRPPRRWIGRAATFLLGLSATALVAGLTGLIHNSAGQPTAPLAWSVGFLVAAGISFVAGLLLFGVDRGEMASPVDVAGRVITHLERCDLIAIVEQPEAATRRRRWFHKRRSGSG
jgi:hypothetical protein